MKWQKLGNRYYPAVETDLLINPENGIFQVIEERSPAGTKVGLLKICDKFTFDFKIYDLGTDEIIKRIKATWNSDYFRHTNKNLGIIFNGLKGTGKTIAAKILCNDFNLPVIIIPKYFDGLQDFIQSLEFNCIVFIDEAEKVFFGGEDIEASSALLRMIDGVYNNSKKLFILTTNDLSINENLIDRPSRIRYIKEFTGVTKEAINQIISDKLLDTDLRSKVLEEINSLKFTTIDIIENIISEYNIHGNTLGENMFNVPKKSYQIKYLGINQDGDFLDSEVCANILKNLKSMMLSEGIRLLRQGGEYSPASSIIRKEYLTDSNKEECFKDFARNWIKKTYKIDDFIAECLPIYVDMIESWTPFVFEGLELENYKGTIKKVTGDIIEISLDCYSSVRSGMLL